jgi:phosphate transport system permease protein
MEKRKTIDQASTFVITGSALVCSVAVLLLGGFILFQGLPMFSKVPLVQFLFSTNWSPTADTPNYGILTFFFNTSVVTVLAIVFAMPIALSTSIYLALFAKGRMANILRAAIELLASIPSIIYGLVGMVVIVPIIRSLFGGNGYSILACAIVLSVMILPTIISVSEVSIRSVRDDLKWASVAMGATTWQTIKGVVLPASKSGIITALIMGVGRAVGETTAVLLVGGNSPLFPKNLASMGRTLTMNIVTDMSYAAGTHLQSLFATAILLFACVLLLNILVMKLGKDRNDAR